VDIRAAKSLEVRVKRNSWLIAVAAGAVAAAMALAASCTPTTECDYIERDAGFPPTEDDVAYCWQGIDQFGLFALRFERGEQDAITDNLLFVEYPPSTLEPAGNELIFSEWSVESIPVTLLDGGTVLVTVATTGLLPVAEIQVTRTSMNMFTSNDATSLRRAVCRGFGFETPEKQCRGSAARP